MFMPTDTDKFFTPIPMPTQNETGTKFRPFLFAFKCDSATMILCFELFSQGTLAKGQDCMRNLILAQFKSQGHRLSVSLLTSLETESVQGKLVGCGCDCYPEEVQRFIVCPFCDVVDRSVDEG
jgi:hypothetical protein